VTRSNGEHVSKNLRESNEPSRESTSYDAIIIGAGHNGLVCGAYLARAGLKTLVLERRSVIGGAAVSEEAVPGFTFSTFSYTMSIFHPRIIEELQLRQFGFEVLPATDLFIPLDRKESLIVSDQVDKTQREYARFSRRDAARYPEYLETLNDSVGVLRKFLWETPVDPSRRRWQDFKRTAGLLWRYRRAAGKMYRVIDILTQSVDNYLNQWFESSIIRASQGYYASIGTFAGPRSPGTAYVLMHHLMGEHEGAGGWGFMRGGNGAISQSIATSAGRWGLEIRTNSGVERILAENGKAYGVLTEGGRDYTAPIIVCNASCKTLFFDLLDAEHLDPAFLEDVRTFRTFSTAFKMNIAAEAPPTYSAFDSQRAGFEAPSYVHVGPDIEYLEQAYDDAKYGTFSRRPFVSAMVPSLVDDTMAPPGKHVIHMFGGHAPYQLRDADWSTKRNDFARTVLDTVDELAPGFSDGIIDSQLLLPADMEEILGLPQGHIFHGELSLDQLFFSRPVPHYADYRTPLSNLYQCGSSTHPGGGVSGIPGYNAAREILRDLGDKRWRQMRAAY